MIYNLANPKQASGGATFATKLPSQCSGVRAESHGKFYQWDKNVAWNTTGSISGWNTVESSASSWQSDNNPCPTGFVVPTNTQWSNLINNNTITRGGGWNDTDYGYLIIKSKSNSSNKLEFPAIGYLLNSSGTLTKPGWGGYYWSSTQNNYTSAYYTDFNYAAVDIYGYSKSGGFSVRCVRQ